jgi:small-conductance mechanosensitive channel
MRPLAAPSPRLSPRRTTPAATGVACARRPLAKTIALAIAAAVPPPPTPTLTLPRRSCPSAAAAAAAPSRHRRPRPLLAPPPAAVATTATPTAAAAAATAAAAAVAAAPEVTRFLAERLLTVIAAPTLAALAIIALTDLLARQAERLIRARSLRRPEAKAKQTTAAVGGLAQGAPQPPSSPEATAVAAAVPAGSDLAPLLELELSAAAVASTEPGGQGEADDYADDHPHNHHHSSAFPETLALLPLALRGPTRVVLLALVATRALRGLLFIADEAVHTFKPNFGPNADALILSLCAQLRPLDGALVRLYSAAAILFVTWVAIRLKTLLVARYLRRREAEAARLALARRQEQEQQRLAELGAAGGGARSPSPSSAAPQPTPPPPVDLVRLLLPLDEAASWFLAVAACLLVAHNQLGLNLSALVAVGGAGSLVVALGTQQLVSNAVSGLNILLSAPFVVGESVTLVGGGAPAGGISGVVEQVSVVRSRLRTDDDVLVEVPNAALAGMIVYNRSRTDARTRAPTDRLVLRVPLRVRVVLPPPPPAAAATTTVAAAAPAYQRVAEALRGVLEGPLARGVVEPHTVSVDVLRLGEGGGLELLAQAMVLRDKRAEEDEQRRQREGRGGGLSGGIGGAGSTTGGKGGSGSGGGSSGRARVAELLSALAAVAQREGGKIAQV